MVPVGVGHSRTKPAWDRRGAERHTGNASVAGRAISQYPRVSLQGIRPLLTECYVYLSLYRIYSL